MNAPNTNPIDPHDTESPLNGVADSGFRSGAPFTIAKAELLRIRRAARSLLIVQRTGWLLTGVLLLALFAGLVDYAMRWPREVRMTLWTLTVCGAGLLMWRVARAAWQFRPSLSQIALRIERSHADLRGWLASGVDLSEPAADSAMARAVVCDAATRAERARLGSVLRRGPAYKSVVVLSGVLLALFALTVLSPRLMGIGARRVVTPWTRIEWPKRTEVEDATNVAVHPLGTALVLRAALTKADHAPQLTRVVAVYRVFEGGVAIGEQKRVVLTSQDRAVDPLNPNSGALFERLIEPSGLSTEQAGRRGVQSTEGSTPIGSDQARELKLDYWFETEDDRTEPATVVLVEPPIVVGAKLTVLKPAYAMDGTAEQSPSVIAPGANSETSVTRSDASASVMPSATQVIDLGPGNDERAASPPVLAGSNLTLKLFFNKPLPTPGTLRGAGDGSTNTQWVRAMLGADLALLFESAGLSEASASQPTLTFDQDGREWNLSWRLDRAAKIMVRAIDAHGLESGEEAVYTFDAIRDTPPSVVVTLPVEDRSVLATAVVDVRAEGRDDVGLTWLRLERQRLRRPAGSVGAPSEPMEDRVEIASVMPGYSTPTATSPDAAMSSVDGARRLESQISLDLSTLDLKPGDELWLSALAADAFVLDEQRHEPVRSTVRKLRIMSHQELVEQIWTELSGLRRTAIAIDEDQVRSAEQLAEKGARGPEQSARMQTGITDRLSRQEESIRRVERQLEQNQLADEGIERVVADARKALRSAQGRSADAARSAEEAAGAEQKAATEDGAPTPPPHDQRSEAIPKAVDETGKPDSKKQATKAREAAQTAQDDVRDELANLIEMLDQGQDSWASKRSIEKLIAEQKSLMARTAEAGQTTAGKPDGSLSAEEAKQLGELSKEQSSAADRLREAVEKMSEREEQMRTADPAAAQGLSKAALRAQKEAVQDRMQEASKQIKLNQTNNAQEQQSRAIQALENMMSDMEQSAQNRDQVLRRHLASLIESIQGLIAQQSAQLETLRTAEASGDDRQLEGLDRPMGALHQNTLGVLDEAQNGPRETAGVARLIDRAAQSQQAATMALRDRPINVDEALDQEEASLARLQEALASAEKLDELAEEREDARLRAELKKKYAQSLERQITIKESTAPLIDAEQSRRTRNSARLLGQDQESLKAQLAEMREQTDELRDAKVFDFAHRRLNDLMQSVADALGEGRADVDVLRRQTSSIRILQSIVDSLDGRKKKDDAFRDQEQGQQGSSQGGGSSPKGLPKSAELKLLRSLQEEAMLLTREVGEAQSPSSAALADAATLQRELAEQAKDLLKRVSQQSQEDSKAPTGVPARIEPATPPERVVEDGQEPNDQPASNGEEPKP